MQSEVTLEPFRFYQVPLFLAQAQKEGWRCEEREFRFVLKVFPSGCWVARKEGRVSGFVTSIKYQRSGWIGNLLVRQRHRGHGIGRMLMARALASLDDAGASTIWLTASEAGRPLYEKLGFVARDRVVRWRGRGIAASVTAQDLVDRPRVEELDRLGWGDNRSLILDDVLEHGALLENDGGYCVMQKVADGFQLGPWGCKTKDQATDLLDRALALAGSGEVVLDSPESNLVAASILEKAGLNPSGRTVLMYRGATPAYQPELIYALASMGSMG